MLAHARSKVEVPIHCPEGVSINGLQPCQDSAGRDQSRSPLQPRRSKCTRQVKHLALGQICSETQKRQRIRNDIAIASFGRPTRRVQPEFSC